MTTCTGCNCCGWVCTNWGCTWVMLVYEPLRFMLGSTICISMEPLRPESMPVGDTGMLLSMEPLRPESMPVGDTGMLPCHDPTDEVEPRLL